MSKLHLVFGGRVKDPRTLDFDLGTARDLIPDFPPGFIAKSGPNNRSRCSRNCCACARLVSYIRRTTAVFSAP